MNRILVLMALMGSLNAYSAGYLCTGVSGGKFYEPPCKPGHFEVRKENISGNVHRVIGLDQLESRERDGLISKGMINRGGVPQQNVRKNNLSQ